MKDVRKLIVNNMQQEVLCITDILFGNSSQSKYVYIKTRYVKQGIF
jgi:hypothetical protein